MSELIERALREADMLALTDEPCAAQVIRELVARMRDLEAQRDAARATRIAVIEREIEATRAATIERCAQVAEIKLRWQGSAELNCPFTKQDIAAAIRALKPSGGGQSEKPVNPYLLGGSSTQSEG